MVGLLPSRIILDPLLADWLREDIGRGDRTTTGILSQGDRPGTATWIAKETGVVAGLPMAKRVFELLDSAVEVQIQVQDGEVCQVGQQLLSIHGPLSALLTGERVALNIVMPLSGIATATRAYAERIADLSAQLVDTRKTTPGLRILEKYATQVGGAINHRMGLDDAVMIKENHIAAAGGIERAIAAVRATMPYPLSIEVETENLDEVAEAVAHGADIIMLDNMSLALMGVAIALIRAENPRIKIEASGNITLETIRAVAETGVDYISTSAPITRSPWLDLSMRIQAGKTSPKTLAL